MLALLLSAIGAFATSKQSNTINQCFTIPSTSGPSINAECPYNPAVQCCFIAAGSSSQYVTQIQGGAPISIRRNPSQTTTIFGIYQ
jgi:hypothetical protein